MFYQTFHGKKIVGGYTGLNNPELQFIENSAILSALSKMKMDQLKADKQSISEEIKSALKDMKIHYVIVHLGFWYQNKKGTTQLPKLRGGPFMPLFLRGFPQFEQDKPTEHLLKLFLSSEEGNKFQEVFGKPIFADKEIVVYDAF
jgi:hypothetical protein